MRELKSSSLSSFSIGVEGFDGGGGAFLEGVWETVVRTLRRERRVGGWNEGDVKTARGP